jgi:hypothetical protein
VSLCVFLAPLQEFLEEENLSALVKKAIILLLNMVMITIQRSGSANFNTAMLCDTTGRHLVMMPHIERSTFQRVEPIPKDRRVSPWHKLCECRKWIEKRNNLSMFVHKTFRETFFYN